MGCKTAPDLVIAIDPSGSFSEGKGTTGLARLLLVEDEIIRIETDYLEAKNFSSATAYWSSHLKYIAEQIEDYGSVHVVMEDYRIYGGKAKSQINSSMETVRLIGIIQMYLADMKIPCTLQMAVEAKTRWTNEILVHKGFIVPEGRPGQFALAVGRKHLNKHCMDALRHGVHYITFKKWQKLGGKHE